MEARALQQKMIRIGNKGREQGEPCGGVQQLNTSQQRIDHLLVKNTIQKLPEKSGYHDPARVAEENVVNQSSGDVGSQHSKESAACSSGSGNGEHNNKDQSSESSGQDTQKKPFFYRSDR